MRSICIKLVQPVDKKIVIQPVEITADKRNKNISKIFNIYNGARADAELIIYHKKKN